MSSAEAGLRRCTLEGCNERLKDVGPLLVHGGAIGANDAVSLRSLQRSKAARDFLLDLGHAYCLFCKIVGERHIGLGHETPNVVAVANQSANQVGGLALFGSAAFASRGREWVFCLRLRQNGIV